VVLFLLLAVSVGCAGQPATPVERARAIESQVWSPYCPGRLLSDCTTVQARDLRAEIEERAIDGESSEEIFEWLRADFGEKAVARPLEGPAGLVIWLVPLLVLAAGAGVVARVVRRGRRAVSADA
jgi:cytochrome c-type biogenesis protein CcmH